LPAATRRRLARRVSAPSREYQPGDLVCGECGEANQPTRKFCGRCGASLASAVVHVAPLPWYRRLLDWALSLRPGGPRAAQGPGQAAAPARRRWIRVINLVRVSRAVVVLLAACVLLAFATVPPFRQAITTRVSAIESSVQRLASPTFDPVHAIGVRATSQVRDHPAGAVIDGYKNTHWGADLERDPHPSLILDFDHPVAINVMLFTCGNSGDFAGTARPMQLHLVFSNGSTQDVHLADKADPQQVHVDDESNIGQIEIHVVSIYPSAQSHVLSMTEVEMFTKE
jgi:hypothetical protein